MSPGPGAAKGEAGRASGKSGERPAKASAPRKQVVGWREWVALPELGVRRIKAKLDTGARSSALHAFNVKPVQRDGRYLVEFDVHPLQRNDDVIRTCLAEAVDYRWITNSGGGREKRFVIITALQMAGDVWPIEVTLTGRDQMGFRMLIGRTAMERRLVIDPTVSYCLDKPHKTKSNKKIKKTKKGITGPPAVAPAHRPSGEEE